MRVQTQNFFGWGPIKGTQGTTQEFRLRCLLPATSLYPLWFTLGHHSRVEPLVVLYSGSVEVTVDEIRRRDREEIRDRYRRGRVVVFEEVDQT